MSDSPPPTEAQLRAGLAAFENGCLRRADARPWTEADAARWQRVSELLIANALAQPAEVGLSALAERLRGEGAILDEEHELDDAVRWWQARRAEGLPVESDFGELWRAFEWLALLQQLQRAGALCQAAQAASEPLPGGELQRLLAGAAKVALRYAPLKPLLPLLEPLTGQRADSGFTF